MADLENVNEFDEFDEFDDELMESMDIEEEEEIIEKSEATEEPSEMTSETELEGLDEDFDSFDDFGDEDLTTEESITEKAETPNLIEVQPASLDDQLADFDGFADFGDDDLTEENDNFGIGGVQQTEDTNVFSTLNAEETWTTEAEVEQDSSLGEVLGDELEDKSSFDSLFTGESSRKMLSTGTATSVLANGACGVDAFTLEYIDIPNIIVWGPRIRKNTDVTALATAIKNDGLLQPPVVAPTQTEGKYVLIKGLRRLMACAKNGMKTIPCLVNHQISNSDIHVVEPIYSHSRSYSVSDMLSYIEYIKKEKNITSASMIEYLLDLESGDYMKLMDVMDDNDDEIVGQLLTGQLTIGAAFKKLEQKRKKTGKDKMADARAEKIYGNTEASGADILAGSGEMADGNTTLSKEEMENIIGSVGDLEDMSNDDGEALRNAGNNIQGFEAHKQDPNDRERLDPKLRKAVLARDNNTCRICNNISGQEYTEVLDVHHLVEVYLGGDDDIHNLITACTCCHKLIHLWGRGELQVRSFDEMDEAEAAKFKRIIKLGNIIREGMVQKGLKKDQLKKMDKADTIGRRLKGSSDQVAG